MSNRGPAFIPALLGLLLLAACGGGGDDGGNEPPPPADAVAVTGIVSFQRVPFRTAPAQGLDYANPIARPARGVTVRALRANTQTVLDTATTSGSGAFTLQVPANTDIVIQVLARMQNGSAQSLPRWDVRVQNGRGSGANPYSYTGAPFNSASGASAELLIPTGISANGTATGTRASGPFAILDTLYTTIQALLTVEPQASLPALLVDWGSQRDGSFFGVQGSTQFIALNWDLQEDTEEFDEHVIAHEFGHYLEYNFSRFDSGGGDHGLGDRLDPRVAFSEGFGYAFAAFALDDPVLRDSFVDSGTQVHVSMSVETNPVGNSLNGGCWCSESTVWSLLWDLHDTQPDGADNIALGFQPIWDAMTGAHAHTESVASIFSFIAALKQARPADAVAINALVQAQNIVASSIEPFASTETNAPYADVLPVIATITAGTPVTLRTIDNAGRHNKVGNHRLLRFTPATSRQYSIHVSTSNPNTSADPDFLVLHRGDVLLVADSAQGNTETDSVTLNAGATYIIDAYDCANGCDVAQGTPGDYDLTISIN